MQKAPQILCVARNRVIVYHARSGAFVAKSTISLSTRVRQNDVRDEAQKSRDYNNGGTAPEKAPMMEMDMKVIIAVLLLASSSAAMSQSLITSLPGVTPGYSIRAPNPTTVGSETAHGVGVTPTMRREQLQRAKSLHAEVVALQSADGGDLTPQHLAYVRQKADAIRALGD